MANERGTCAHTHNTQKKRNEKQSKAKKTEQIDVTNNKLSREVLKLILQVRSRRCKPLHTNTAALGFNMHRTFCNTKLTFVRKSCMANERQLQSYTQQLPTRKRKTTRDRKHGMHITGIEPRTIYMWVYGVPKLRSCCWKIHRLESFTQWMRMTAANLDRMKGKNMNTSSKA